MADDFDFSQIVDSRYNPFTDTYTPYKYGYDGNPFEVRTIPSTPPYIIKLYESPQLNIPSTTVVYDGPDPLTEVSFLQAPGNGEFRVQYDAKGNGSIEFNSAQSGLGVSIAYYGLGTLMQKDTMQLKIVGSGASKVIASSDSSPGSQSIADEIIATGEDAGSKLNTIMSDLVTVAGGGSLYILEGTYNCSSSVDVQDKIDIRGAGYNTVFIRSAAINSVFNSFAGRTSNVSNLRVDGNKSVYPATSSNGFYYFQGNSTLNTVWSENNGGDGIYFSHNIVNSFASDNGVNGFDTCLNLSNIVANNNGNAAMLLCRRVNNFSISNGAIGVKESEQISNVYILGASTVGIDTCQEVSSCEVEVTPTGYLNCDTVTGCYANNTSSYGYNGCKGMQQNRSLAAGTAKYNNCFADLTGTTYPIAAGGTDTPNGGFNS
jgi:hypothetical protein